MADEDEKILKTGNLKVKRDSKNNRFMKFVDEDPALNKRSNDYWVDVNTKVQQYFGYKDYKEYKIDNQEDLTRKITRDENGKVTSAPTLWPFHVAYVLEEFRDTLDGEDYAVVGVPKNKELEGRGGVVLARQIAAARKEYFKPGGRLDLEMKNPRETLTNKELVGRAKERLDFNSAFQEVLVNKSAVHPETVATMKENGQTLFWAENVGNYRDVASREDMNWLGIPVMTNTKKIGPGQIAKNEKGDFLMEHERAGQEQHLGDVINEEYRNVLQEAVNDKAFYDLIRKATAGSVVNLFFTKNVKKSGLVAFIKLLARGT
mgnify:FL=1